MAVEEERKYEVEPSFALPEPTGALPDGARAVARALVTLTATYYDTADLRLARAGGSLRFRDGDQQPWTVKLPTALPGAGATGGAGAKATGLAPGAVGVRHEISRAGEPGSPPAELVALVTATTRGAPLAPVVVIRSHRKRYELRDASGTVLAELADDTVSVLDDAGNERHQFREVEVERAAGDRELLDTIGELLTRAGAVAGEFTPKHVRALGLLGDAAAAPPDLPPPAPLGKQPRAGDVVTQAIRRAVGRIVTHDPLLRLREPLPDGDTPVHQVRVGCRRLRSDLRTFDALIDPRWTKPLRRELRWLAGVLGDARDAEVLRERLHRVADDPLAPVDAGAVARIDAELAARQSRALDALDTALASDRYTALLDVLVDAARQPRLLRLAEAAAREVLPRLVAGPWRALAYGSHGVDGALDLDPQAPDERWHAVRVYGKRARYAVEAVAGVVGGEAPELSKRLATVQDLLGEHQDAAVAGQTWLSIAESDPADHALAVAAGQLYERERAAIRRVRKRFPAAWRAASKRRLVSWLP